MARSRALEAVPSRIFHKGSVWIGDDALRRALYTHINTALISDNWLFVTMAQDGLANLKEGLEEAFADLGIQFQLKQVRDNLVLSHGFQFQSLHGCLESRS